MIMAGRFLMLSALGAALSGLEPTSAATLPRQTAADLNGRTLRVPEDLDGDPAILLVAFEEAQQAEIDRVMPMIESARTIRPNLSIWELPIVENPGAIGRALIDTGMRAGIPDEKTRARVVTLYVPDRKEWMRSLGIGSETLVSMIAIKRSGEIVKITPTREIKSNADAVAWFTMLGK